MAFCPSVSFRSKGVTSWERCDERTVATGRFRFADGRSRVRRRDAGSVLRTNVTSCEAGEEPLPVRPVRGVGEGEEPGLREALVLPYLHQRLHLKQRLAALVSHGDDEVGHFLG